MKTFHSPNSLSAVLVLVLPMFFFTGCCEKCAMLLIPPPDKEGRPPLVKSYRGDYVIIPRPLPTGTHVVNAQELQNTLNQIPNIAYHIWTYRSGEKKDELQNNKGCLSEKAWKAIDAAAKETQGSNIAGEIQGGVSCNNTNLTDQQAADFAAKFDAFLKAYASGRPAAP